MPGPPPKDTNRRRRSAPPTGGEWIDLPNEPYDGPKPRMPRGLNDRSKITWRTWWSSPVAAMWHRSDWPNLVILIRLLDQTDRLVAAGKPVRASTLAELRAWEDRHGLSPSSRRVLRWRIDTTDTLGESETESQTGRPTRWASLHVVK